jgi:hypothetical protein
MLLLGVGFVLLALAYIFEFKTGLGLAKYIYINDLLLLLSRADIPASLFFIFVAGIALSVLWRNDSTEANRKDAYPALLFFARAITAVLLLSFIIQCLAITERFDISKIAGWHQPPFVPYQTMTLKSGLAVNFPTDGELCWRAPLPCIPQHYLNVDLNLQTVYPMKGVFLIPVLKINQ